MFFIYLNLVSSQCGNVLTFASNWWSRVGFSQCESDIQSDIDSSIPPRAAEVIRWFPTQKYLCRGRGIRSNETPRTPWPPLGQLKQYTGFWYCLLLNPTSRRRCLMTFPVPKKNNRKKYLPMYKNLSVSVYQTFQNVEFLWHSDKTLSSIGLCNLSILLYLIETDIFVVSMIFHFSNQMIKWC